LLAGHYGLTEEELDFPAAAGQVVINYDIKYRMGEELEGRNMPSNQRSGRITYLGNPALPENTS